MYDKLVLIQEQFNYSANVQLDMDNSERAASLYTE